MLKESNQIYDLCMVIFENSLNVKKEILKLTFRLYAASCKYFSLDSVFNQNLILKFLDDLSKIPQSRLDVMKCLGEICKLLNFFILSFLVSIPISIETHGEDNYYKYKNLTVQLYKSYILEMHNITKGTDFNEEYKKIKEHQKFNFEDFALQFSNSLISFYKNNFNFIQEFDSLLGSSVQQNDFTTAYMKEIGQGLLYLAQCQLINSEEIFKATNDFFYWFCYKITFLIEKNCDPEIMIPSNYSLQEYIFHTSQSNYYINFYYPILDKVRSTLIEKMIRPSEVKMDVEDGELVYDQVTGTIYTSIFETMRDTLIFLTHLNPQKTQERMIQLLNTQIKDDLWNVNLLNSTSWAIGCISGSLSEDEEKKFVVTVIKYLLGLCENKKGKTAKASVASNIMYVVGQYYRFLNKHWRFLKTVVKKLFEFMHEMHPGVMDFACETFLRISIKCGEQFTVVNEGEDEPYINTLVRTIKDDTQDLTNYQKLMFYEAIGNMISTEYDAKKQVYLVSCMMENLREDWMNIFQSATTNQNILLEPQVIRALDIMLKINEKVCSSVKTNYYYFAENILKNVFDTYVLFSTTINTLYENGQANTNFGNIKNMKKIKKSIINYIISLIINTDNTEILLNNLSPYLSNFIEQFKNGHLENKDSDILIVFKELMNKLKNLPYEVVESIWTHLCLQTLSMIQQDFVSFPEHRYNFFELLKSLITNEFNAIFKIQDSSFNKNIINAILWAFRHSQHNIAEVGLETLKILLMVSLFF